MSFIPYATFKAGYYADNFNDWDVAQKIEKRTDWPTAPLNDRAALEALITDTNAILAKMYGDTDEDMIETDDYCWGIVDANGLSDGTYDFVDILDFADVFGSVYGTTLDPFIPAEDLFEVLRGHSDLIAHIISGEAHVFSDPLVTKLSSGTLVIQ